MGLDENIFLALKQQMEQGDYGLKNRAKKNNPMKQKFGNNRQNRQKSYRNRKPYENTPISDPTTPYNFVSLNDIVVKPPLSKYLINAHINNPLEMQAGFREFLKDTNDKKYSGYFTINIKNLTPLYIGGANDKFFSDGQNICIPGSSLRGCVKNIFKIITNSAMRAGKQETNPDITDKHLYFRSFASAYKDFRNIYANRMIQDVLDEKTHEVILDKKGKKIAKSKALAGFLVRKGKQYFICPAQFRPRKLNDIGLDGKSEGYNDKSGTCEWHNTCVNVFSGQMFSKKHFYEIKNPNWRTTLTISDDIINDYRDDKNRKGVNLLDKKYAQKGDNNSSLSILKGSGDYDFIMPCFYVANGDTVEHFGANPYYRIPYNQSIADHIPAKLKSPEIDFTDAVFGNKECWESRVYFEDSYLQGKADFYDADYVKILMTPNPTSFQFYLTPEDGEARHWDTDSEIRGYKFYWHKKMRWQGEKNDNENFNHKIAPLRENQEFIGKIRFQNLDAIELGALAFVLGICETKDQCFKLGMGKPIGMGTIKLTAKLYLQDKTYYTNLFSDNGFYTGSTEQAKSDFTTKFTEYLKANMPNHSWQIYNKRLEILHKLLSIDYMEKDNAKINELTRYMDINNKEDTKTINKRKPLPTATDIVKKFNSK